MVKEVTLGGVAIQVNIYEAKTRLSELVERAAQGEEVVIAKSGRPRARLVAIPARTSPRTPGAWVGKVRVGADFDAPLDELFEQP